MHLFPRHNIAESLYLSWTSESGAYDLCLNVIVGNGGTQRTHEQDILLLLFSESKTDSCCISDDFLASH